MLSSAAWNVDGDQTSVSVGRPLSTPETVSIQGKTLQVHDEGRYQSYPRGRTPNSLCVPEMSDPRYWDTRGEERAARDRKMSCPVVLKR